MKRLLFAIAALALSVTTFAQRQDRSAPFSRAMAILNNEEYRLGMFCLARCDYGHAVDCFISTLSSPSSKALTKSAIDNLLIIGVYDFDLLRDKLNDAIRSHVTLDCRTDTEENSYKEVDVVLCSNVLGLACENHGCYMQAIEVYRNNLSDVYGAGKFNSTVAYCYALLGHFDEAVEYIDKAVIAEPDRSLYLRDKANMLYVRGDLEDAAVLYAVLFEKYASAQDLFCHASILYEQGDIREAIKEFTKALELAPGSDRIILARGLAYQELGDKAAALNDLNEVAEYGDYLFKQCALIALGRGEEVDISVSPDVIDWNPEAYYHAAILNMALGDVEEAMSYLRLAVQNQGLMFYYYYSDPLLAPLRATKEYKEFIGELSRAE